MKRISQIFIVLLLTIEFNPHMGHVISDLENGEKINENNTKTEIRIITTITFKRPVTIPDVEEITTSSTPSTEYITNNANVLKQENADNKSIEYLIEEPNSNTSSSHEQQLIIKPLEEYSVNLVGKTSSHNSENQQNSVNLENFSKQSVAKVMENLQLENTTQNLVIESAKEEVIPTSYDKKEELIINLLDESNTFGNKSENQTSTAIEQSTMTSIKIHNNSLNKILTQLTKNPENQFTETLNKESITPTYDKKEDLMLGPINLPSLYAVNTDNLMETTSSNDQELVTMPAESQKEELNLKSEDAKVSKQKNYKNPTISLVQTLISSTSSGFESEEKAKLTTTLEDYAVKQMNFILDYMLLESQEFVAKVLQATGNTIFQRDHLKRYAESLNRLLNPSQLDSSGYDDNIFDTNLINEDDLYEEVIKKLNFLKSKATKQLQRHLPADWVKDYKDKREELKIWLNKVSAEMHREFNLYLDDEEDHIKYLYFNEAFDDIGRATEIHQKLALLADLIEIVKNKKQITFMDLYMQ